MPIRNRRLAFALILATSACDNRESAPQLNSPVTANNVVSGPTPEELAAAQHRAEIERILEEDAQAGRLQTSRMTATAMRAINIDLAPTDFRQMYLTHLQAWEDVARLDEALAGLTSDQAAEEAVGRAILETILGGNRTPVRDLQEAIDVARSRRAEALERRRTSWQQVEQIAVSYSARLPRADTGMNDSNTM